MALVVQSFISDRQSEPFLERFKERLPKRTIDDQKSSFTKLHSYAIWKKQQEGITQDYVEKVVDTARVLRNFLVSDNSEPLSAQILEACPKM